jgi:hypothetical protein
VTKRGWVKKCYPVSCLPQHPNRLIDKITKTPIVINRKNIFFGCSLSIAVKPRFNLVLTGIKRTESKITNGIKRTHMLIIGEAIQNYKRN